MEFNESKEIISFVLNKTLPAADESLEELNARYALALLPFTIVLGLFGFVGILGNILIFIVYGCEKKYKDQKYRVYVLNLAIIDFITCLTLIPAEMWKHQSYFDFKETALCKVKCFFNVFAAASASFCLCVVAIDRYIMTCHPFLFVKVRAFSHNVAWRLCGVMILLGIFTAVPAAVLCGIAKETMRNKYGNTTEVFLCVSDPSYETGMARYIYKITIVTAQTIISIIIVVLYIKIGLAVVKVMKLREFASVSSLEMQTPIRHSSARSENSMCVAQCRSSQPTIPSKIKLLFLVTVVFLVTYFLYVGMMWIDQTELSPVEFVLFSLFFRLYFSHSIINPMLYAKMDTHFRRRCISLLHL